MSEVSPEVIPAEQVADEAPAPDPVPVVAKQPSSASDTQQPEEAEEVESEPMSLEDAVKDLLVFVKAHRTAGDADLGAAVADVEAALAAQDEKA